MPFLPAPLRCATAALVLLLSFAAATLADAQELTSPEVAAREYTPGTGDAWLDRHLKDINDYAERHPHAFADEVSRYYAVPRAYVEAIVQQPAWTPADIFMACALAQRVQQACRAVVREWSRDHEQGWAGLAKRLELEPGSAEHRQLREDVRASYRRWARPLLDR